MYKPKIDFYNEDCLETMGKMPSGIIDLTVTSPPYDNLRDYDGYSFDFEATADELYRVTKKGGVVVWIVSDSVKKGSETGTSFKQALYFKEIGFNLHDTMIWKKDTSAFPERVRYNQVFEYMFVLSKDQKPKTFNPIEDRPNKYAGTKIHGTYRNKDGTTSRRSDKWNSTTVSDYGKRFNVWEIPTEKNNKTGHPAVFPRQIAKDHIKTWSNEHDLVYDPFTGSGTTGAEACQLNRDFVGSEISKEYFDNAVERLKALKETTDEDLVGEHIPLF